MTEERKPDLMTQLLDLSETAIQKLAETPGADKVLSALKGLGERVDELTRRSKGYDELERRVSELEATVSGLTNGAKSGDSASGESGEQ
jgi:hypothetical protein